MFEGEESMIVALSENPSRFKVKPTEDFYKSACLVLIQLKDYI